MGLKLWCHRRSCSTCNTDFYFDGQLTPVSLDSLVPLVIIIIPSVNSTMVKWGRVNTLLHCSNSLEVWNKFRKTTTKTRNVSGFLSFLIRTQNVPFFQLCQSGGQVPESKEDCSVRKRSSWKNFCDTVHLNMVIPLIHIYIYICLAHTNTHRHTYVLTLVHM